MRTRFAVIVAVAACLLLGRPALAAPAADQAYASPDDAVAALVAALRTGVSASIHRVLGPGADVLVSSGDKVQEAAERTRFLDSYDAAHTLVTAPDGSVTLEVGQNEWPLPFPLRKGADGAWRFDAAAGAQQVLDRRIGRNEVAAIQTLLALADAEADYADRAQKAGNRHYADHVVSSGPGQQDGLYWPAENGEPASPLGPLVDAAAADGYTDRLERGKQTPYRGYLFHVLTAQGPDAPGGARAYVKDGSMTEGFGFAACPAVYGGGGYMSFIVNQDGVVFQKDLGPETAKLAAAMTSFNPDLSWARVDIVDK